MLEPPGPAVSRTGSVANPRHEGRLSFSQTELPLGPRHECCHADRRNRGNLREGSVELCRVTGKRVESFSISAASLKSRKAIQEEVGYALFPLDRAQETYLSKTCVCLSKPWDGPAFRANGRNESLLKGIGVVTILSASRFNELLKSVRITERILGGPFKLAIQGVYASALVNVKANN